MKGKLYLVATPIGNLEDITLRAIRILKEVDIILAEDTRQTIKLLNHLGIKNTLISFHRHSDENKIKSIINKLLEGQNIAIVSDAGTPCISDPGEEIVKKAIEENISIIPIPGACAAISALIVSGLSTKEFIFIGFLSQNKKLRKEKLKEIEKEKKTIILYETPHDLLKLLEDLEVLQDRKIILAREITKVHEEYIRGTAKEVKEKIKEPKGEFVIIIEGDNQKEENPFLKMTLEDHYKYYNIQGLEKKEIIKQIAKDRKVAKNEIYKEFIGKE